MRSTLKYIFSVLLLTYGAAAFGQVGKYAPTSIRIGADPGTLGYMVFSEKRNFFEVEAEMDIDRFFVVADYGVSSFDLNEDSYTYENDGSYLRLGADINFMDKDPDQNVAFFGLRYAMSSFKDQLDYNTSAIIQSEIGWPSGLESVENDKVSANWYEMVAGIKIRIVKQLYFGFTARFKLKLDVERTDSLRPYYVPGFGKHINNSAFGFNYYVSYKLPFRKKQVYIENDKVIEKKGNK